MCERKKEFTQKKIVDKQFYSKIKKTHTILRRVVVQIHYFSHCLKIRNKKHIIKKLCELGL